MINNEYSKSDYDELLKRYNAAQISLADLSQQLVEAQKRIMVLEAEKKQWEIEKINQQSIIHQQLGNSDNIVRQLQEEIMRIKSKYNIKD